jgi:hypothetical protein
MAVTAVLLPATAALAAPSAPPTIEVAVAESL